METLNPTPPGRNGAPRPAATPKSRDAAAQFCQLGNGTRLDIVRLLVRTGPPGLAVGAIRDALGIPGSTLSHHLRQLQRAGLLVRERRGTVLRCQADYDAIEALVAFLTEECCSGAPNDNGNDNSNGDGLSP